MSWIVETDDENALPAAFGLIGPTNLRVGSGFLLPSIKNIQPDFKGRIWANTLFTVPHDEEGISPAGEPTKDDPNWGVKDILAEDLWDIGARGQGIKVGIADTGIDGSHPCFSHQEFSSSNFAAFDNEGQPRDILPSDSGWHGTHCAGVIAGREESGVARGVAPEATLCIARVFDGWNGTPACIKSGLAWLQLKRCDVVSLSLGWPGLHDEWATEINDLIRNGAIVVAASGNEFGITGTAPTRSPANYPISELVCVGAYDRTRSVWLRSGGGAIEWPTSSQFGGVPSITTPYLVGPGVDIVSSVPGAMYKSSDGTSMATPHIAGLLACALSYLKDKGLQNARDLALNALTESLVDLGDTGMDTRYGRGAIDPHKFITELQKL